MTSRSSQPPWEFLLAASRNSLQSFELSRLSHAADLRKELAALLDQWVEETSAAMVARWLLEQRERTKRVPEGFSEEHSRAAGGHAVSDNFFVDRGAASPVNPGPI